MSDVGLVASTPTASLPIAALAPATAPTAAPAAVAATPSGTAPTAAQPIVSLPVAYGCTVEIEDVASGHQTRYKLVHSHEANPRIGLLSEASPVGRALVGRCAGERARVHTPRGLRELLILAVA
jgi:GreA/GreB family transcription elongation factor